VSLRRPLPIRTPSFPCRRRCVSGTAGCRVLQALRTCEAILYVPVSVIWECSLLVRVGKINLRSSIRSFFDDLFSNPAYQALDLSAAQVFLADESPFKRDPFDGLIVAAARTLDLPLITRDASMTGSGVLKTVW
jgi:PIN domain nuclease of toxin-antitoxin system